MAGSGSRGVSGGGVRARGSACRSSPGVHAHDGTQQLASLDRMVPALLSLPPRHCLLHDSALLCQGKCVFNWVGGESDVLSVASKWTGEPEVAIVPPHGP